ncbi:MAG: DUF58 domain-containing protein [Thermodesulfovibrionaceae bacterium]
MIGFGAVNTGNNLLFLIVSFLLSIMALSGIISYYNLRNINISISSPLFIFAKKPVTLKISAKNRFFIDAFLLRVKILDGEILIPHLRGEDSYFITVTFPERGKHKIERITVYSFFPFYFFKRNYSFRVNFETIVYPYPLKCDISLLTSNGKIRSESNLSREKGYMGELIGVKTYSGDPLKYIHWKVTAKTSELKTKEFSTYKGTPIIIDLDDLSGTLEEKLSKATYILLALSKDGNPIGLKLDKKFFRPDIGQSHLRKLLYALAIYEKD